MIDPAVAKVPVHLALMAAESVAFLPPNKSPTKEDHSKYGANFDFLDVSAEWLPYIGVVRGQCTATSMSLLTLS